MPASVTTHGGHELMLERAAAVNGAIVTWLGSHPLT